MPCRKYVRGHPSENDREKMTAMGEATLNRVDPLT